MLCCCLRGMAISLLGHRISLVRMGLGRRSRVEGLDWTWLDVFDALRRSTEDVLYLERLFSCASTSVTRGHVEGSGSGWLCFGTLPRLSRSRRDHQRYACRRLR